MGRATGAIERSINADDDLVELTQGDLDVHVVAVERNHRQGAVSALGPPEGDGDVESGALGGQSGHFRQRHVVVLEDSLLHALARDTVQLVVELQPVTVQVLLRVVRHQEAAVLYHGKTKTPYVRDKVAFCSSSTTLVFQSRALDLEVKVGGEVGRLGQVKDHLLFFSPGRTRGQGALGVLEGEVAHALESDLEQRNHALRQVHEGLHLDGWVGSFDGRGHDLCLRAVAGHGVCTYLQRKKLNVLVGAVQDVKRQDTVGCDSCGVKRLDGDDSW